MSVGIGSIVGRYVASARIDVPTALIGVSELKVLVTVYVFLDTYPNGVLRRVFWKEPLTEDDTLAAFLVAPVELPSIVRVLDSEVIHDDIEPVIETLTGVVAGWGWTPAIGRENRGRM